MNLINREDLLKKQCSYYDYNGEKVGVVRVSDIVTAPVKYEPELIRCKDCKYYGRVDKRRFYRGYDCLEGRIASIVPDKDFCSRAERKEEP